MIDTLDVLDTHLDALSNKKVLIVTHKDPDGDGLPAAMVLAQWLFLKEIDFVLWVPQGIPQYLKFLPFSEHVRKATPDYFEYDVIISLDASSVDRIADYKELRDVPLLINIDHHQDNQQFGNVNILEPVSSVSEILVQFQRQFQWPITPDIALCLYAAIAFDTGNFRFENATAKTFEHASYLVEQGAKPALVSSNIFDTKPDIYFSRLKEALEYMVVDDNLGFVYTYLPKQESRKKITVIDVIRQHEACDVALVFQPDDEGYVKISLRSEKANVAAFAKQFGGGGHIKASGIRIQGELETVIERVVSALKDYLS